MQPQTDPDKATLAGLMERAGVRLNADPDLAAEILDRIHAYASELAANARLTYESAALLIVQQLQDFAFNPGDPQARIQETMERLQISVDPATDIAEIAAPRREAYPVRNKYAAGRPPGRR